MSSCLGGVTWGIIGEVRVFLFGVVDNVMFVCSRGERTGGRPPPNDDGLRGETRGPGASDLAAVVVGKEFMYGGHGVVSWRGDGTEKCGATDIVVSMGGEASGIVVSDVERDRSSRWSQEMSID